MHLSQAQIVAANAGLIGDTDGDDICPDHGYPEDECGCDHRANVADSARKEW